MSKEPRATQLNRDFQVYAEGSRQLMDPDEYTIPWFHTQGERNYGGWGTPELDKVPYMKNFRPDITNSYYSGPVSWIDKG